MKIKFLSLILLLVSLFLSKASIAATYAVKIEVLDPPGETQNVICSDRSSCRTQFVPGFNEGQREPVIVPIAVGDGRVYFRFQTRQGYLHVGKKEQGSTKTDWLVVLDRSGKANQNITLFLPADPDTKGVKLLKDYVITHKAIADILLTIEPVHNLKKTGSISDSNDLNK